MSAQLFSFSFFNLYPQLFQGVFSHLPKLKSGQMVQMKQTHSTQVIVVNKKTPAIVQADGLITNLQNVYLVVKTADCLPLLIFDPKKKVTAAVHVGWRGAVGKIFLIAILKMIEEFGCQAGDLLVGIGPAISGNCYVHSDSIGLCQSDLPEWQAFLKKKKGKTFVFLADFVVDQLQKIGVKRKNIEVLNQCTACNPQLPSHFAKKKGRIFSIIGLKDKE